MSTISVESGEIIGPYKVVRGFRGQGGMAQICEVQVREKYQTPDTPKRLALKIADEEHQAALVAEADYLRRFNHPNIVRIYPLPGRHKDAFAARERFSSRWGWYYAMELLEGGSLEQRLIQTGLLTGKDVGESLLEKPLPLAQVWGIAHQLALALEHIHTQSVINLDVKPANVLFRKRPLHKRLGTSVPVAVLSDFGIARDPRYPRFGTLGVATPAYVSPEHTSELRGQHAPLDSRSDIFSLGVVLYEMLTGRLPFEDIGDIIDPYYMPPPLRELRPRTPAVLEEIVMHALQKNPDYRYQSATEFRHALERVHRPTDWVAVGRRLFASVVLTAGLVGGGYGGYQLYEGLSDPVPKPTNTATITPTVSSTLTPSPTPESEMTIEGVPPPTKDPTRATSTPRPTSTPTPIPLPTHTPTATPESP